MDFPYVSGESKNKGGLTLEDDELVQLTVLEGRSVGGEIC